MGHLAWSKTTAFFPQAFLTTLCLHGSPTYGSQVWGIKPSISWLGNSARLPRPHLVTVLTAVHGMDARTLTSRTGYLVKTCPSVRRRGTKRHRRGSRPTFTSECLLVGLDKSCPLMLFLRTGTGSIQAITTFVALGLLSTVQDNFRKHIRPYFMAADGSDDKVNTSLPKKLYDVLCLPGLHWAKTFAAFPFCVSTVANAWAGETRMGYLGLATLVFGLFVVPMIPVKRPKKKEA